MRYLVTGEGIEPFLTEWFDPENNFNPALKMVVFDLVHYTFTTDGVTWKDITFDHL